MADIEKSKTSLEEIQDFEESLLSESEPAKKLEIYTNYIEHMKKAHNPTAVQR